MTTTESGETRAGRRSGARRSVAGSLAASGVAQLALIVSGVLAARSLGPEDRGYLALLVVVASVCGLLGTIGLPSAITYFIAREPGHASRIASSLLRPGLYLLGAALALQTAILVVLVQSEPERVKIAASLSLLLVPGILALFYGCAILQGQQRSSAFHVLRIVPTVSYVVGVALVFALGMADLVSIMLIWAGANFVGGFLALGVAVRGLPVEPPQGLVPEPPEMTRFGLKAFVGSTSPVDALRLDQAVVGLFLTPVALGYYVVAQALAGLPRVVAMSVGLVAYPQVASQRLQSVAKRLMWRYFLFGSALCGVLIAGLLVVTGPVVELFFGEEFASATSIARILLVAAFFLAARRILTDGLNGRGHPGLGTVAELTSWVFLLPSIAVFLPWLGADGVALALAVSAGLSLALLVGLAATVDTRLAPGPVFERLQVRFGEDVDATTRMRMLAAMGAGAALVTAGIGAAFFPVLAVVVGCLAGAVLVIALGRSVARRVRASMLARAEADPAAAESPDDAALDHELRPARRLYYASVALIGVLSLRAAGQVTLSDLLILLSMSLAAAELVLLRKRIPVRLPLLLLAGMTLFTIGGLISSFDSYSAFKSTAVVVRIVFITVFWFWLGTVVLSRHAHVRRAVGLWVGSVAVCGAVAVLQTLLGEGIVFWNEVTWRRATGLTEHPNDLGGMCAIALVPALMLAVRPVATLARRIVAYAFVLAIAAGLILSASVGGLLAAVAALLVWLTFQPGTRQTRIAYSAIAIGIVAAIGVQELTGKASPLDRLDVVLGSESTAGGGVQVGSVDSRVQTYRVAVREISENPFVGVGLDLISVTAPFGKISYEYEPHNLVIGTWYKAGLFGLLGVLVAMLAVYAAGWSTFRRARSDEERMLAVALTCGVVAFTVFSMGAPVLYSRYGWIPAALLLALRAVQLRSAPAEAPAPLPALPTFRPLAPVPPS